MNTQILIQKILDHKDLHKSEAENLMTSLMDGSLSPNKISSILTALRMKTETTEEITGFISVMRKNMQQITAPPHTIDTCGTGGDQSGTFNISTAVALLTSASGVPVAKHGNRAASSKSGSADLLEALGINIFLKPIDAETLLKNTNFVFLFAPLYHPSMKHVAPIRKELGFKTIFNVLGPFANPASVKRQIVGVPNKKIAQQMAEVAMTLDYEHLYIVTSHDGLDEISISAETDIFEVKKNKVSHFTIVPEKFGIQRASIETLKGNNAIENASIIHSIFSGKKSPKRDIVIMNTGFALFVSGIVQSVQEGMHIAEKMIDNGVAEKKLQEIIKQSQTYEKYIG